jgi:hypothetical protein
VAHGVPLSIALLSYGDTYGVGIDTDPAAIPDPEVLHRYLAAAVDDIEHRAVHRTARPGPHRATPKARRAAAR